MFHIKQNNIKVSITCDISDDLVRIIIFSILKYKKDMKILTGLIYITNIMLLSLFVNDVILQVQI